MVIFMVFFTGCIISAGVFAVGDLCPDEPKDCFIYDSSTSLSHIQSFECVPGEPIILVNSSGRLAKCYKYILNEQKTIDILNQLGICTGLVSLSANILWFLCWIASRLWGRIILVMLSIGGVVAMIVIVLVGKQYEVLNFALITLFILLMLNATFIAIRSKRDDISKSSTPLETDTSRDSCNSL